MSNTIEITNQCAPRTGEAGLRENWQSWTPEERRQFIEGLAQLGWVPAATPDLESGIYPGFVALPGNPCYRGINAGPVPGGGNPGDPFGVQGFNARNPSGLLDWLRALLARLSEALRNALARLMAALGGPWLALLAAALVAAGILLAGRDRQAKA